MKTIYIDCGMGAAGDMLTAALLELLPDPDSFIEEMNSLGIEYTDTILPCARTFFTTLPQLFDHPSGSICHPAQ